MKRTMMKVQEKLQFFQEKKGIRAQAVKSLPQSESTERAVGLRGPGSTKSGERAG